MTVPARLLTDIVAGLPANERVDLELQAGRVVALVGSSGARMLAATIPYADAWNAWYADTRNEPAGVAPLRARVDEALARELTEAAVPHP